MEQRSSRLLLALILAGIGGLKMWRVYVIGCFEREVGVPIGTIALQGC